MNKPGTLYLLPVSLGECNLSHILPQKNIEIVQSLKYFIAENAKEARAFLKKSNYQNISNAEICLINQHADKNEIANSIALLLSGNNVGLMSDAGCPGIADPGADVVKIAHEKNIKVVPLVGPSSIVLSIMASGFNGQNFAFNGYLPIDKPQRLKKIKELEQLSIKNNQAQFFIETPYRNESLFDDMLKSLPPNMRFLVATDITLQEEAILVKKISDWKKSNKPNFHKKPTVFGFYMN
jgi:16S rRNA (cytidine1402-2'-O)-methyltransferase